MTRKTSARVAANPAPAKEPSASTRARTTSRASPGGPLTKLAAKLNARVSTQVSARKDKAVGTKPSTRRNKKGLVLYVDPAVTVALRRLALDRGTSVQTLGMAALNMLFVAHGVGPFPVDEEAR